MSDAIKKLHDYLAKSPSMIYPQDALEYLPAIEAENAKLRERINELLSNNQRMLEEAMYAEASLEGMHIINHRYRDENDKLCELVRDMYEMACPERPSAFEAEFADRVRELGVEVDE